MAMRSTQQTTHMEKRQGLLIALLCAVFNCAAQNNPIFSGGPGDGWASNNHLQQEANNIFTGGSGDGWASNNYQQPESNIFLGGAGDGWAKDMASIQLEGWNAIEESAFGSALHAYPNPTSGLLNIDLTGEWGPVTIEVSSASGQLVMTERYTNTGTMVIDVPGARGQYLIRLSTGTGHTTFRILKR